MLVIGISGTHCSGKTTLVNQLKDHLENQNYTVKVISELARECPYPVSKNGGLKSQLWQSFELGKRLIEGKEENPDYIITDRTFIDFVAYLIYTNGNNKESHDFFDGCKLDTEEWFDYVFLTDILYPLEDDGFRDTDPKFQEDIKYGIERLHDACSVNLFKIKGVSDILEKLETGEE